MQEKQTKEKQLKKETLSEQIYKILREDILHQNIKGGERLTLKVLQNRFGVSSTPIREALTRLVQDNLAVYYSNIGIEVIQLTRHDLEELYQFMGDLDALAILYASRYPDQEQLRKELRANYEQSRTARQNQKQEEWMLVSDRFHLIFYDYCQNSRLADSAQKLRSQLSIYSSQYELLVENQEQIQKEHEEIFHLYMEEKITDAAHQMREHLLHSLDFALKN